jgi:F-type H+-transporting ATPase subunit epsilon
VPLPTRLVLEVVAPAGLLLKEEVDEVIAPGADGYFGVLPGHTPFLAALGVGEISYRHGEAWSHLTCFWGFCEVLPGKVSILAEIGERAEDIDVQRAEAARAQAEERMKSLREERGFEEARQDYVRAVTRLAVARHQR